MPTVLQTDGYRFFFYSMEPNEPPHVHVTQGGRTAKYWIDPVELTRSEGFKAHELTRLRLLVIQHRLLFLRQWNEHHHPAPSPHRP